MPDGGASAARSATGTHASAPARDSARPRPQRSDPGACRPCARAPPPRPGTPSPRRGPCARSRACACLVQRVRVVRVAVHEMPVLLGRLQLRFRRLHPVFRRLDRVAVALRALPAERVLVDRLRLGPVSGCGSDSAARLDREDGPRERARADRRRPGGARDSRQRRQLRALRGRQALVDGPRVQRLQALPVRGAEAGDRPVEGLPSRPLGGGSGDASVPQVLEVCLEVLALGGRQTAVRALEHASQRAQVLGRQVGEARLASSRLARASTSVDAPVRSARARRRSRRSTGAAASRTERSGRGGDERTPRGEGETAAVTVVGVGRALAGAAPVPAATAPQAAATTVILRAARKAP